MDRFVNPYTFVPRASPVRRPAIGHLPQGAGDRLSGTIDITVTLETPMLVTDYVKAAWLDSDNHLRLPGSSLKGAVRAVHEAAFNGCLRVVDGAFVPGYRAPASAERGWTLGVVLSSEGGMPTAFQPCNPAETVWVDALSLQRQWPRESLPTSGDLVRITGDVVDTSLDRYELTAVDGVDIDDRIEQRQTTTVGKAPELVGSDGAQVFLVTDTGARTPTKRNGSAGRCLWASSILLPESLSFDPRERDRDVYEVFRRAAAGTNDRRTLEQERRGPSETGSDPGPESAVAPSTWRRSTTFTNVMWRGRAIARRARQTGFLFRGDVVWIRREGDRVTGVKLATIWREPGRGAVGTRIGTAHPCLTDAAEGDALCLSCQTFGAADASEGKSTIRTRQEAATQRSYAGHVRFGTLTSNEPVHLSEEFRLAPLGQPNPGSGAFYLQMGERVARDAPRNEVASHWGSRTDSGATVKGRKFYWHANPREQQKHWAERNGRSATRPRYEATPEQVKDKQGRIRKTSRVAHLVPAGTRFTGTVTVDALPAEQVDALLASLDPRRLLGGDEQPRRLATHLGGGKPHGLGSATVAVVARLHPLRQRYTTSDQECHEFGDHLDDRTWAALTQRTGATREGTVALQKILDLDGLGDDALLVTYPPSAGWSRFGTQAFRESYQFFQRANGQQLQRGPRPWHVLPEAAGDDVTLPIIDRTRR